MDDARRRIVTWPAPAPGTPPPVSFLVGLEDGGSDAGLHRVTLEPVECHYNPLGTVHGGIIATVLETAMAAAVRAIVPPGRDCVTAELKVSFARALTKAAGTVAAEGRVVHAGRQVVLAEARLVDAQGRLYATASSVGVVGEAAAPLDAGLAVTAEPGERRRVVEWGDPAAGAKAIAAMAGLEALSSGRGVVPVGALIGMTDAAAAPGRMQMSLPPGEHLHGSSGAVHGGMLAVLLDSVLGCAIHTTLPAGRGYTTLDINLSFLRPATAAGGMLTATGRVVHGGERTATAEAQAVDAMGRLCATGTTTCLLFDMARAGLSLRTPS